jgi:universal stress protein A
MSAINKILCPVDFSDYSNAALEMALQIAEANKASLHLIYVLPKMNYYDWTLTGTMPLIEDDLFEQLDKNAREQLNKLVEKYKSEHPQIIITAEMDELNNPADGVLNAAKTFKADMIVMGSHGRKGFDRILMGSVAESVMRNAECSVVIYKK